MATRNNSVLLRIGYRLGLVITLAVGACSGLRTQAQTAASASQLGTVKSITGDTVALTTDAGQAVTVVVASDAKILQLAVGSTDLKTAKPGEFTDIAVGDRVLVSGKAMGTGGSFSAARVVVMKHAAIEEMQAAQQADWKANGVGGIVNTVDAASGVITLTAGDKKLTINTSSKTEFKRFSGDSVKYGDAKAGTIAQIQVKDQLQARGTKSADGTTVGAVEVVSGSFLNLSGLITSIDPVAKTIALKDLLTKKAMIVNVTANCEIHAVPAQVAMMFAARTSGGQAGAAGGGRGGGGRGGGGRGGGAGGFAGGGQRSVGADLAQMMDRLPAGTLADLKTGDAVMIVASQPAAGSTTVTGITLLSGVEPILTANPNGGMDLSMSLGGGGGGGE